jgi:hypothetical protein
MSIKCLFGVHQPSLSSIAKKATGYTALCESCARPLERQHGAAWRASDPLDMPRRVAG